MVNSSRVNIAIIKLLEEEEEVTINQIPEMLKDILANDLVRALN